MVSPSMRSLSMGNTIAESRAGAARDTVADFHHDQGDRIDLHAIDADQRTGHAGNQAFRFIGSDSFAHYHQTHPTVVGMIRFDAGSHVLQGNVGANLAPDFEVKLLAVAHLAAADFIL